MKDNFPANPNHAIEVLDVDENIEEMEEEGEYEFEEPGMFTTDNHDYKKESKSSSFFNS